MAKLWQRHGAMTAVQRCGRG